MEHALHHLLQQCCALSGWTASDYSCDSRHDDFKLFLHWMAQTVQGT
jgi:hypothetical protein